MSDRRMALVVGAGASAECNLPTGAKLKHRISELLDIRFPPDIEAQQLSGDSLIYHAFKVEAGNTSSNGRDIYSYQQMGWRIRDAMPQAPSIDNFIDVNRGDELLEQCCKLAIVRAILDAEKHSPLYFDLQKSQHKPRFDELETTWLTAFFQLLTENCEIKQLAARLSRLTLIVFNYDRCIEHYLFHAFQNYYGVPENTAAELMTHLTIYHPYGTVGSLPWQNQPKKIDFGANPSVDNLLNLAGQIRTFTEGTDPSSSSIVNIREKLLDAQTVIFLGFAYHKLNLELLKSRRTIHVKHKIARYFGTAFKISPSNCDIIHKELTNLGGTSIKQIEMRKDLTCAQLFGEYWRSLSLS